MRRSVVAVAASLSIAAAALVGAASPASAVGCGLAGAGTAGDPWRVSTDADLLALHTCDVLDGYYLQEADLTAIGGNEIPGIFSGHYDGGGHTIHWMPLDYAYGLFLRTNHAHISNLRITADPATDQLNGAGWISGRDHASTFDRIVIDAPIDVTSGGIVGRARRSVITNSYSTGAIGHGGGGLVGARSLLVTVRDSFSTGVIDASGGGILGENAVAPTVVRSHSTGTIGYGGGGIVGAGLNSNSTDAFARIRLSYSTGEIGEIGGGIAGSGVDYGATTSRVVIRDSFSLGRIGVHAGGIIGSDANGFLVSGTIMIQNSFSVGDIGVGGGGIAGAGIGYDGHPLDTLTLDNVFSTGSAATDAGGLVGLGARHTTVMHAYTSGAIATPGNEFFGSSPHAGTDVVNSYAESTHAGSGFTDSHFNTATSGKQPWGRGVWGSCAVNALPYLQALFANNPCRSTPTVANAVVATFDAGDARYRVSPSSVARGWRDHFSIVNAIASLPSGRLEIIGVTARVTKAGRDCTRQTPCVVPAGWMIGGGQQATFAAETPGRARLRFLAEPGGTPVRVGVIGIRG